MVEATRKVDLDELARLEEERDFLLRSIADLDREYEAGDVDPADYEELRNGYVARAADAIRAVDSNESTLAKQRAERPRRRGRGLAWTGGVVVFTIVAGVLLANALGSRSEGASLTGTGAMPEDAQAQCRTESLQKPADGIACYAKILKDRPDDVDALTYQGWAMVRSGDVSSGSANFDRVVQVDPKYADVHVFRASVLKNAGDFVGAQKELDTLFSLNPSPITISTLQQMGLDTEIATGLLPADVAACWKQQDAAMKSLDAATANATKIDNDAAYRALTDLTTSAKCFDPILAARPDDIDALTLDSLARGLLAIQLTDQDLLAKAQAGTAHVLELRPNDPTALLLRAFWRYVTSDLDGATADLDALGDQRISPLLVPFLDRTDVRSSIASARSNSTGGPASTTTIATSTTSTP